MYLSWGHPRRALPVILALWSPDFPHTRPLGLGARLSNLVAEILYSTRAQLSNTLANSFRNVYTIAKEIGVSPGICRNLRERGPYGLGEIEKYIEIEVRDAYAFCI